MTTVFSPNIAPGASAYKGFTITPSDTLALPMPTNRLWIGVTGNITVLFTGDTVPVPINNVPVGLYKLSVIKVMATGTTATGIVGLV